MAMMSLAACNGEGMEEPVSGSPVEVTVSVRGAGQTKATDVELNGASSEAKVNTLQVFVFNGDDREAYRSVSDETSALVPATSGERTVWAVVNGPSLEDVMTLSALKAFTTSLSDNALDSFVMSGGIVQELTDGGVVPVTVRRQVSRVSINRITTGLTDYREGFKVDVKGIYLVNVPSSACLELPAETAGWANRLAHNSPELDALCYDGFSPAMRVDNSHPYAREHVFYTYPNVLPNADTPDDFDSPDWGIWSPRGTLLVLDVDMLKDDGTLYKSGYYPVALPAMERNKTYVVEELRITRLPGDSPYEPIVVGEARVTVTVKDWETGINLGTVEI